MLAVNGAVRVVVVARKLMMSTVSYIHTWHTRWLTWQFEDLKICEWIRRSLLTVYSQCMEKLIFSFPEAAQAKDKYQIINETLELMLAFFSVFFFKLLRPQAKFGWVCETIRFRRDPLAICMDTNRLAFQRAKYHQLSHRGARREFVHSYVRPRRRRRRSSVDLFNQFGFNYEPYSEAQGRLFVVCLTRSRLSLRLLVQRSRFLTRWPRWTVRPRPHPRIDKLHFLN